MAILVCAVCAARGGRLARRGRSVRRPLPRGNAHRAARGAPPTRRLPPSLALAASACRPRLPPSPRGLRRPLPPGAPWRLSRSIPHGPRPRVHLSRVVAGATASWQAPLTARARCGLCVSGGGARRLWHRADAIAPVPQGGVGGEAAQPHAHPAGLALRRPDPLDAMPRALLAVHASRRRAHGERLRLSPRSSSGLRSRV